jgi:hypothetical protein
VVEVLTGLMIFGVVLALYLGVIFRFAVDTTDGQDWMERQVQ